MLRRVSSVVKRTEKAAVLINAAHLLEIQADINVLSNGTLKRTRAAIDIMTVRKVSQQKAQAKVIAFRFSESFNDLKDNRSAVSRAKIRDGKIKFKVMTR